MSPRASLSFLPAALLVACLPAAAAPAFPGIGQVKTRAAREIAASTWSIGAETLDRDYAVYDAYKEYLGPLGAKAVRLQAGWAKTEKAKGVYDWAWLDRIVDDARGRGLRPWLQLSYGNPVYGGGGTPMIFSPLPSSDEALRAWDAWVRAAVRRYRDRVSEWEVWNEPDLGKDSPPEAYAPFFLRTARIVREEQPGARVIALSLARTPAFADKFLGLVAAANGLDLVDVITFHTYPENPDDLSILDALRAVVAKYPRPIELREGENGAPSAQTTGALSQYAWSERTQAKWDLRRMLAFHGNGIPYNLFTISDFRYPKGMNRKGLIEAREDGTAVGPKLAYGAAQRVFSIFDATLAPRPEAAVKVAAAGPVAAYAYGREGEPVSVVALWEKGAPVSEADAPHDVDVEVPLARFEEPVYVDLLSGEIRAVPAENWSRDGGGATASTSFRGIPLPDYPVLLADRKEIGAVPSHATP